MYGLEQKKQMLFEFDLEKEVKKDPKKLQEYLKNCETKIQEIKAQLREGTKGKDLDDLGVLLNGYTALQKVLNRLAHKKK